MTASETHAGPWTVDDLVELDDDGSRHELVEGSRLVSAAPALPHVRAVTRLRRILERHAPPGIEVGESAGVMVKTRDTYLIPDIFVAGSAALEGSGVALPPEDLLLVVEVMSPGRRGIDQVTKRHHYATMGITRYWIVDLTDRTLSALVLSDGYYRDEAVVSAGRRWVTTEPFPLALDPADFC